MTSPALERASDKALRDSHAELLAALKPFAEFADFRRKVPGDMAITQVSSIAKRQLKMADCYKAASVFDRARAIQKAESHD